MRTLYIAGPYSDDPERRTHEAMDAADHAEDIGFAAFVPHLSHFRHQRKARDYEHWMAVDLVWLSKCDALLRLPGHSPGADREVEHARKLGIPVFHSLRDAANQMPSQTASEPLVGEYRVAPGLLKAGAFSCTGCTEVHGAKPSAIRGPGDR